MIKRATGTIAALALVTALTVTACEPASSCDDDARGTGISVELAGFGKPKPGIRLSKPKPRYRSPKRSGHSSPRRSSGHHYSTHHHHHDYDDCD